MVNPPLSGAVQDIVIVEFVEAVTLSVLIALGTNAAITLMLDFALSPIAL